MRVLLQRLIGEHIECSIHTATALHPVKVDPGQIQQVIMNLVVNARDSMQGGGRLTIETANVVLEPDYAREHEGVSVGRHVMLAVTDTGTGMSPEVRSRIFEPFFTTKERGRGTGLGLSTVFGIVKQSGGHIWVYSEVDRGSTFKVYFPASDASDEPALDSGPDGALIGGSETILLVEDEDLVRRAAREVLRKRGYTILEASGPHEALAFCQNFHGPIQLMLTDVVMPNMSGKELAQKLAEFKPEIKVLYMSGYTEDTIVHHGVLDSGIEYLQKPFTPDSLARKVRQVLDSKSG
jgi:CheY-like chemotaxis protein